MKYTVHEKDKGYTWLNEESMKFLRGGYLLPDETVDDRVNSMVEYAFRRFGQHDEADRFISYMKRGFYSISSPVWANFGRKHLDASGISCFGSYVEDTRKSLLFTNAEIGYMSSIGGGSSANMSAVRGRGELIRGVDKSEGSVHFMENLQSTIETFKQSQTRKGAIATYLDIRHKDFYEFMTIRSDGSPLHSLNFGVGIDDEFMIEMHKGNLDYQERFVKVMRVRSQTGYPYVIYTGNMNNHESTPEVYNYIKNGMQQIQVSNLCSEIALPSTPDESFVCCLSSLNLVKYDEFIETDAPELMVRFLNVVIDEFIEKNEDNMFMQRAVKFAKRHRALGIGVIGWHTLLQKLSIPFGSLKANSLTNKIFSNISSRLKAESIKMADEKGACEVCAEHGVNRYNTTLMAVAPTVSSSQIAGQVSAGIEPWRSNFFMKDLAKAKVIIKNRELESLLEKMGKNTEDVWHSILEQHGSVQHLDFLSDHEKEVFKTFEEINQRDIIIQASIRQKYIDQSQSLNLMVHPDTPLEDLLDIHFLAWELGVKSLYYLIGISAAKAHDRTLTECTSCDG